MSGSEESRIKLIAIDDDPVTLEFIEESLAQDGLEILTETRAADGIDLVLREEPEIVLLDLFMPGIRGMELLDRIVEACPATDVVLLTGDYSTDSAVEAIRKGASDYLTKPVSAHDLRKRVGALIEAAGRNRHTLKLDDEFMKTCRFEGMVGRSPLMLEVYRTVRRTAPHFRTVLVRGETGTGKELVARALHRLSPVAAGRMVTCNCTTIVESIFESELFGHVKGAFTGAVKDKEGMVEYARGGVLFLDEIGDMPIEAQAKLLRVVERGEYQRVGSPAVQHADLHIIAATNCDLLELMKTGKFREDLYYRLSMVEIQVPSLADRREDLPILEKYFVDKFANQYKKTVRGITPRAQIVLSRYSWPGNIRELENVIGHACMMTESQKIDVRDLPDTLKEAQKEPAYSGDNLLSLSELNKIHIHNVLEKMGGNKARAAEILGINRATLYRFLKEAGKPDDTSRESE
jgi:DNA-binding NtrC family response regulator